MEANASASPTSGCGCNRDVNRPTLRVKQLPESGGTPVADDGALAASKSRGHPSTLVRGAPISDGVHAPMKAVKSSGADTTENRIVA